MKKIIATTNAPKAIGPYSQAVEVDNTIYVSGQIPVNPADGSVPVTIGEQTARCLDNLGAILTQAGYAYSDVVKTTVLLDDIGNFGAMNEVYAKYFTADMPARACYQVGRLPMDVKVEIEAVAAKSDS